MTRGRAVLRGAWRALCVVVIAIGVLVIGAAVVVPRLGGATPYTILTGSMTPTYPPGTLVVVREVPPEDLVTGDVVTFQLRSGERAVATHRVVGVGRSTVDGEVVLTTQGDANAAADAEPVRAVQVRGRVWYAVPYLGHLGAAFAGQTRQTVVYVVAGGLLLYAASMLVAGLRERRAGDRGGRHREDGEEADDLEPTPSDGAVDPVAAARAADHAAAASAAASASGAQADVDRRRSRAG